MRPSSPSRPFPPSRGPAGRSRTARRRAALALLAATLALTGCGGSDEGFAGDDAMVSMPAPAAPELAFDDGRASDGGAGIIGARTADERAIVRNASIELVVDDGATGIAAVVTTAAEFDGTVASTTQSRAEDGSVSGSLTLRVPSTSLDALVDALDALARAVPFRSVDEVDVTLQLSDIDAQLANLRAFEDELRALLTEVRERDGTVEGLVAVSDRLRQVRTEIDVIEGRRVQLADQVALSTVYVSVSQARSTTPIVGTWDVPTVVRDALAATVRLGQLAVEALIWLALTVLPAAAVGAVLVLGVRSVRRRRSVPDRG